MHISDVNIRDPFILPYEGKYYLYGTRSATTWGPADGFDCYVSSDLDMWEGPFEIFHKPEGFFADQNYWAPECIYYGGAFYLVTTFGADDRKKGIYVLKAEVPVGPFVPYSACLTPSEWVCIDGSIYFEEDGTPILFFSHSFEDSPTGDMCCIPLTKDLKAAAGEPIKIFEAADAVWAKPVPFAKAEFDMDGDVYFTDGPGVRKMSDGKLYMTWSSWSDCGYAVGVAVCESGSAKGPWHQMDEPIFPVNGGHGMMFEDFDGTLKFALHYPNDKYMERPVIYPMYLENGVLKLKK